MLETVWPPASSNRKIDPQRRQARQFAAKPDGSPDNPDRTEIGPTDIAFAEWAARGLTPPNLERMRQTRLDNIVRLLNERELAGVVLFDPLNIRYATDSSNMQVWTAHNPSRAALVCADGHMVLWDFHGCEFMSAHLPLIKERRCGAGFFYFVAGDQEAQLADTFVKEVDDVVRERVGASGRRIALDKIELHGFRALSRCGLEAVSGWEFMEHVRAVKGVDEINAMRCSLATTEIAVAKMRDSLTPGIAETELWSILHKENIARGGEWIETRILASGQRTNPWMQECGPRRIREGELLAFDTDLIGPYGMCADFSRTWFCGDGEPTQRQKDLHKLALEHIQANRQLLEPGVTFKELTFGGHQLPEQYVPQQYCVKMHGVGLCDEWPSIYYPQQYIPGAFDDHPIKPGMVMCVEAYIGEVGGPDGVKLEEQVLITEDGYDNLTHCPFDPKLLS